ncbi:MAG: hypothetical protein JXR91_14565 [Deltaproteobacteria bacterium]|nr:hypothetical protein [Deltaproteobacteria bacterium]
MDTALLKMNLEAWCGLLEELASVLVDPLQEPELLAEAVNKRASIIAEIEKNRSELDKTMILKKEGWPGINTEIAGNLDNLIMNGEKLIHNIIESDKATIKNAGLIRKDVLDKLKRTNMHKNYLVKSAYQETAPPVIVDDRA